MWTMLWLTRLRIIENDGMMQRIMARANLPLLLQLMLMLVHPTDAADAAAESEGRNHSGAIDNTATSGEFSFAIFDIKMSVIGRKSFGRILGGISLDHLDLESRPLIWWWWWWCRAALHHHIAIIEPTAEYRIDIHVRLLAPVPDRSRRRCV